MHDHLKTWIIGIPGSLATATFASLPSLESVTGWLKAASYGMSILVGIVTIWSLTRKKDK